MSALIDNLAVPSLEEIQARIDDAVAPIHAQLAIMQHAQTQITKQLGIIMIDDPKPEPS